MKYTICNYCAIYIMYDDSSHLTPVEKQGVDQFISELDTTLVYVNHEDDMHFTCNCCQYHVMSGTARYFEENK